MGQSTLTLPDPDPDRVDASGPPAAEPPHGDRRRFVRQKLHSPAYVSFNVSKDDVVVDLNELLDLHEEGCAVQTGEILEVNQTVALTIDLPETRTFIHSNGQVVWSDPSGRGGLRFSEMSEDSKRLLREWLFSNLLIACSNHEEQSAQLVSLGARPEEAPQDPLPSIESSDPAEAPDLSNLLSGVDAIRRVLRELDADRDTVFQLITAHALRLTGASGAALAFLTDENMICCARAGDPAPPLGAAVDAKGGLSGECVRSASLVACHDTENDPRVDQETCRRLGIGSIVAVPIVSDFRVVGLLEVFSPYSYAFTNVHETVLERLVETIPKGPADPPLWQDAATGVLSPQTSSVDPSIYPVREKLWGAGREGGPGPETGRSWVPVLSSRLYLGLVLLGMIAAATFGYWVAPAIQRHWFGGTPRSASPPAASAVSAQNGATRSTDEEPLEAVRKRAEAGDADAQYRIGLRYHLGDGVPKDDSQAAQWYLRAADHGHVIAQGALGACYWAGRGVPTDLSRAYFWSALAFAQGDDTSKSRLEGLATQMTRSQVNAARLQADDWIRQHNQGKKPAAR